MSTTDPWFTGHRPTHKPRNGHATIDIAINFPAWMDNGLCAQTDPEAFYPEQGESSHQAKNVCALCPVRLDCLRYAIDTNQQHGVWGGLTATERRRIVRDGIPLTATGPRTCALDDCDRPVLSPHPRTIYCSHSHAGIASARTRRAKHTENGAA